MSTVTVEQLQQELRELGRVDRDYVILTGQQLREKVKQGDPAATVELERRARKRQVKRQLDGLNGG